jgi:hypothetical protein
MLLIHGYYLSYGLKCRYRRSSNWKPSGIYRQMAERYAANWLERVWKRVVVALLYGMF